VGKAVRLLIVKANAEGFKALMVVYALILSSFINAVVRNIFTVACFITAVKSFMFAVARFINED
jgi:hypothetical protein